METTIPKVEKDSQGIELSQYEAEYSEKEVRRMLYFSKKKYPYTFNKKSIRQRARKGGKLKPESDEEFPLPTLEETIVDTKTTNLSFGKFITDATDLAMLLGKQDIWNSHATSIVIFCYQMWRSRNVVDYIFSTRLCQITGFFPVSDLNDKAVFRY